MMCSVYGELEHWPTKKRLATILSEAGFKVYVGRYSIRIEDFTHFTIQEYGGDMGDPVFDADADDEQVMIDQASRVSEALGAAGLVHRFEVIGKEREEVAYFHHGWPDG